MKINNTSVPAPRLPSHSLPATSAQKPAASSRPASRDEFVHDASARKALAKLNAHGGESISASELIRAIESGTKDKDSNAASGEFREFARFAKQQGDRLNDRAKAVIEIYAKTAKHARGDGETGLTTKQTERMLHAMHALVGKKTEQPKEDPKPGEPKTARDWQREAMKDPDSIFKRQAYSAKWNPNGPLSSGNCATCSLAMAAESFGVEPSKFDKPGHVMDQRSIAWTAHKMGKNDIEVVRRNGKLVRIHTGDFKMTFADQVRKGALAMGLHAAYRQSPGLKQIDRALARGHMMQLAGEAGPTYRARVGHTFSEGHSILIMGKTSDGRYLVADPLSRKGPLKLTAAELRDFDTSGHVSNELWRGK